MLVAIVSTSVAAKAELFSRDINLPGSVAPGVTVCWSPFDVSFAFGPSCIETPLYRDTPVDVLEVDGNATTIRLKGNVMYANAAYVHVVVDNKRQSLHHFLMRNGD